MTVTSTQTTCPYCGVGCGLTASPEGDGFAISGDPQHPANNGRACIKGSTLNDTLATSGRLLTPMVNGKATSWDNALNKTASGLDAIIRRFGPDAVGMYVSGQLLTEDYYVANKLMKGFIGSGNIDTNSRLCMSSAVAAHKRAFGEDLVPGCYEDLELADVLILVGSNMAYTHPVLFQRIQAARHRHPQPYIIVIDPRRTATCDLADMHLPLAPDTDAIFFNGLLQYLYQHNRIDREFIGQHTRGFAEALSTAHTHAHSVEQVAKLCDIDASTVEAVYRRFTDTPRVVTAFCQGVNQSAQGTDKANAIINCHLASGKIGKPGATPFSITGQPNAMGGREVGGLANTLASHMDYDDAAVERIKRFWRAPNMATRPGLKAVDLFDAVHAGKVKALWIMGTNPVVSMPDANYIREALHRCELVIVSDCTANTDTGQLAHIQLPALSWGEKTGTVTNSERCISLQRAFLPPPGEARADWQILRDVAHHLGYAEAFDYQHPADIFREHAALSGFDNNGDRAFNIADKQTLSNKDYMAMTPFQWPQHTPRLFADGSFYTPSKRAHFIPIDTAPPVTPADETFSLNTGRLRDQWHSMTRTGTVANLFHQHTEPHIAIHPDDAARLGLINNTLATVGNARGHCVARINLSERQRIGEAFMPIHWSGVYASDARVSALVERRVDPVSGQPHFKQTAVTVESFPTAMEGLLLLHDKLDNDWTPPSRYWSRARVPTGTAFRLADPLQETSTTLFNQVQERFDSVSVWLQLADQHKQTVSLAGFTNDRLVCLLLTAPDKRGLSELNALTPWLGEVIEMNQRFRLLEGDIGEWINKGPIVCSCHQVGQFQIERAIKNGCNSTTSLGKQLRCGTNCGSCLPELQQLLQEQQPVTKANGLTPLSPEVQKP